MNLRLPIEIEVGKTYKVPCIRVPNVFEQHYGEVLIPVFPDSHIDEVDVITRRTEVAGIAPPSGAALAFITKSDPDYNFKHYHVDVRFTLRNHSATRVIMLSSLAALGSNNKVVWKSRKCLRLVVDNFADDPTPLFYQPSAQLSKLELKDRYICPHQKTRLEGIPLDESGVITCPAHGLRWCTKTRLLSARVEKVIECFAAVYSPDGYEIQLTANKLMQEFTDLDPTDIYSLIPYRDSIQVIWKNAPEPVQFYWSESAFECDRLKYE